MEKIKTALTSVVDVPYPVGQGVTAVVLSALTTELDLLLVPLVLLLAVMLVDYSTGLRAAKYRGEEISGKKGLAGIEKKVYLLVLVGIGLLIDSLIIYMSHVMDVELPLQIMVAVILSLWLLINEMISILENIKDMGVDLPSWLLPLVKNIHSKVETKAPGNGENETEEPYCQPF